MGRRAQVVLVAAFMLALVACSEADPLPSGDQTPPAAPTASPSPEVAICDQLLAARELVKDANTGAFTSEELIPRALELRDWFWEQADELKGSGEDYIVDPQAVAGERTASHKLRFLGTLLGQWANGETTTLSVDVFTSEDVQDFDCR